MDVELQGDGQSDLQSVVAARGGPTESIRSAKIGAWLKLLAVRSRLPQFSGYQLTEHETALCYELAADDWTGEINGTFHATVDPKHVKALINDNVSGGEFIVPTVFDADVLSFPLLFGELFPKCNIRNLSRGRDVESASIATPAITWIGNQADTQEISLLDTSSLIGQITHTIVSAALAIEIGNDWLSDTPVEVGNLLSRLCGERVQAELDRTVAVGSGTNEIQGLANAPGITTISSTGGASGPWDLADYSNLMAGLPKAYRQRPFNPAFISSDTTYFRGRQIKIDTASPSTDQRPVLSGVDDFENYRSLGRDHLVQNDFNVRHLYFGNLQRFVIYRRQSLQIQFSMEGRSNMLNNTTLMVCRLRYGGKLVDPAAFVKITDGQSA